MTLSALPFRIFTPLGMALNRDHARGPRLRLGGCSMLLGAWRSAGQRLRRLGASPAPLAPAPWGIDPPRQPLLSISPSDTCLGGIWCSLLGTVRNTDRRSWEEGDAFHGLQQVEERGRRQALLPRNSYIHIYRNSWAAIWGFRGLPLAEWSGPSLLDLYLVGLQAPFHQGRPFLDRQKSQQNHSKSLVR
jgi:hypothetical protein